MNDYIQALKKIRNSKQFKIARKENSVEPFDNQIDCAIELLLSFEEDRPRKNYIIIKGCTQAGKTGVFIAMINLIYSFNLMKALKINTIYYITGDNSRQIISQTNGSVIDGCIETIENMESNGLKVILLKQSDMKSEIKTTAPQKLKNAFIFIDESHYGSKKEENILITWLKKQGLSLRNDNDLVERDVYIASNSATPYGEIESDLHYTKRQILLRPGNGYCGLWDFTHYYGLTKDIFSKEETVESTIRVWHSFLSNCEKRKGKLKCVVARVSLKKYNKFRDIINNYFDVIEINSFGGVINYNEMEMAIMAYCSCGFKRSKGKYLMIIVQGGLRMGVRIDEEAKNHIGVIYDFVSSDKNISSTEQGILGRICGYRVGKEYKYTRIYARKSHINALLGFYKENYVEIEDGSENIGTYPSIGTIARTPYNYYVKQTFEFSEDDHSDEYGKSDWFISARRFDYENCESDYYNEWKISPQQFFESKVGTSFFKGIDNFQLEDLKMPRFKKFFRTFVEPFLMEQDEFYRKAIVLKTRRYLSDEQKDAPFCEYFKASAINASSYDSPFKIENIGKPVYTALIDVRDLKNITIATVTGRILWAKKTNSIASKTIDVIETMDTSKAK